MQKLFLTFNGLTLSQFLKALEFFWRSIHNNLMIKQKSTSNSFSANILISAASAAFVTDLQSLINVISVQKNLEIMM